MEISKLIFPRKVEAQVGEDRYYQNKELFSVQ